MTAAEPIRVLIVDDSRIFRGVLESIFSEIAEVRVVGSVFNGERALEFVRQTPPDLVTLDVEMPGLSGLETLAAIRAINEKRRPSPPIETLLVSALTTRGAPTTIEGLHLGALDFIPKPTGNDEKSNRAALREIVHDKLEVFRQKRFGIRTRIARLEPETPKPSHRPSGKVQAVAIGVSTGGPEALVQLLPMLPANSGVPVFIVQHILPGLSQYLADSLSRKSGRLVAEATDGAIVERDAIYLAPAGKHMTVRFHRGHVEMSLNEGPPENGCRPAVDVFFRSAAAVYGPKLLAVVLTGMGQDGAQGTRAIHRAGGYILAQDEASSVVWGMPRAAIEVGHVDEVLALTKIGKVISSMMHPGSNS